MSNPDHPGGDWPGLVDELRDCSGVVGSPSTSSHRTCIARSTSPYINESLQSESIVNTKLVEPPQSRIGNVECDHVTGERARGARPLSLTHSLSCVMSNSHARLSAFQLRSSGCLPWAASRVSVSGFFLFIIRSFESRAGN